MRILRDDTILVVVDVQERLFPHIYANEHLLGKIIKLVNGCDVLELPAIVTEQYPKGLGHTVFQLHEFQKAHSIIEKMSFSCCGASKFLDALGELNRKNVILCGIETHVCVQQTALDLLDKNYQPIIIADAVSSRHEYDKQIALKRLEKSGAIITTTESILFELCEISGTEEFKKISQIVK